jgi:PPOX class probable F420-dependent enzyme
LRPTGPSSWQSSSTSPGHAIDCCSPPPVATAAHRSLGSAGVDVQGRIVISTYPARAKTRNAERDPRVSVLVLSDDWNGPWVQIDGHAEVLHMPDAADGLVDYFRCISGEHPDWEEYREAMHIQDKSLIRVTPTRWGPIATGGFPADVAARLDG